MWLRLWNLSPNLELPLTSFHRSLYVYKLHATTSKMQPCRHRSISWLWWSPEADLKPCTAACKKWMQSSIALAASPVCISRTFLRIDSTKYSYVHFDVQFSTSVVNKPRTYSFTVRSHEYVLTFPIISFYKLSCNDCKNSCFEVLLFVVWLNWHSTEFWESSAL